MNKTALITGASGGIGLDLARLAAADGYDLALVARSENKLKDIQKDLQKQFNIKVDVLPLDLSEASSASEIFDELKDRNVSILINNAGFGDYDFFADANWKKLDSMIKVNITALTELTHLFLPEMIERKAGKIMNVASTAAFQPGPLMAVYYATKAYVLSFSEAIANELKDKGITVTTLCPGPTETGFVAGAELEESGLFKSMKIQKSIDVASYGYQSMMKGKTVAIHGVVNNIMTSSLRFVPRTLVTNMVRKIMDKK
jgi:uncharacterized protein